jgi:heterodisulfide reductase subunit D
MWLEEYTQRLPGVRLLHASELLDEWIAQGRLELKPVAHSFTYHDPCDLARTGGVYEPPRRVLQAIPELRLIEVSERRENGLCCGGGGDVEMVAPQNVKAVAQQTVGKLKAAGAEKLATACPQCLRVLEQAGAGWQALDIVEIVARSAGIVDD